MRSILLTLVSLLNFSFFVQVQCESNFIVPATYDDTDRDANNPRYEIGENIKLRWLTDLKEAAILVVQLFSNSTQRYYIIEQNTTDKTTSWTIDFNSDNSFWKDAYNGSDLIFWFEIYKAESPLAEDPVVMSRNFNVSVSDTDASESSSSSTSGPSSSASSDVDSGADSPSDSGISARATAGIAVGAAVGALLIGACGLLLWRNLRKDKTVGQLLPQDDIAYHQPAGQYTPYQEVPGAMKPELHNESAHLHEAP
ncbi:Ff.00g102460.m01.CDS01 [Fusarium sp. VM40]|nr:Ff.00g102460.m01.CDS01 [Fusarium sp. VM40]